MATEATTKYRLKRRVTLDGGHTIFEPGTVVALTEAEAAHLVRMGAAVRVAPGEAAPKRGRKRRSS